MVPRILVVAAGPALADFVAAALDADGYVLPRAADGAATLATVRRRGYDLLVTGDMAPTIGGVPLIPTCATTPLRPTPMPPNTALLPMPFTTDGLSTLDSDSSLGPATATGPDAAPRRAEMQDTRGRVGA